jgi:hypothetical protein
MKSNRRSGRISILGLAVFAIVGMILASMVFAKEDPSSVGAQFMDALARHDVDKLTELSYVDQSNPGAAEETRKRLREQWTFSVKVAGQYYTFFWRITGATTTSDTTGSVIVQLNKGGPNAYDEKFELPLAKSGDKWKVDVTQISRVMFPALPE